MTVLRRLRAYKTTLKCFVQDSEGEGGGGGGEGSVVSSDWLNHLHAFTRKKGNSDDESKGFRKRRLFCFFAVLTVAN